MWRIKYGRGRILCFTLLWVLLGCSRSEMDQQWAIRNTGQTVNASIGIAGMDIQFTEVPQTDKKVIVAVIDSGIVADQYLENQIFTNFGEIPGDGIDNDQNGYIDDYQGWDFSNQTPIDLSSVRSSHATEIANIIACSSSDYQCVSKNCLLLNIKIDETDINPDILTEAIRYAEESGAAVVNLSMTMKKADEALMQTMKDSRMLFICAAGNDRQESCAYPGAFHLDNIITVGGITNKGLLCPVSNYGETVDIGAPGEDILVINDLGQSVFASGTSYATAFVTGVAAEVYVKGNGELTAADVKSILMKNAVMNPSLSGYINNGRILSMKRSLADAIFAQ